MSEELLKYPKTRKGALELNCKRYFTNKLCKRGHIDYRFSKEGTCHSCSILSCRNFYNDNTQYHVDRVTKWQKENPDKTRIINNKATKKYKKTHPDKSRDIHLRKSYGITLIQFNEIINKQNHCCPICQKKYDQSKKHLSYSVDHDHVTGKFRDVICQSCNLMIAYGLENYQIMQSGIRYLRRHFPHQ